MNTNWKAQFGKGETTYKCIDCGKLTRDTGGGEAQFDLCYVCYERAKWENEIEDNVTDYLQLINDPDYIN